MELKNALAVCLISLFSATLVVLIARSLDSQAASRLEPQVARIVEELQAIRAAGGVARSPAETTSSQAPADALVVYYFHGNTRCPTCQAIESQAHETVHSAFADQLDSGQIVWRMLNYEDHSGADLAAEFDVHMSAVVLARMSGGEIAEWDRLDEVWGLVDDKPAFAEFVRAEINRMLEAAAISTNDETDETPVSSGPYDIPIPE